MYVKLTIYVKHIYIIISRTLRRQAPQKPVGFNIGGTS